MADIDKTNDAADAASTGSGLSRRQFLTGVSSVGVGAVLGGLLVKGFLLPDEVFAIPASEGYIVVDTKKCGGCLSCMLACSLAHHGKENLSLSRIQVTQDPFGAYPGDMSQEQCRQCPYPACVEVCPTGANHVDADNGNVRTIDARKCIGCERCIEACPFTPSRVLWNAEEGHAQKCDLCADTPFWDEDGGAGGKQACVQMCGMRAIAFTTAIPSQIGNNGYHVNLRNAHWAKLGFPTD